MSEPCSVEDCQRPHSAKGYCRMHYRRWRATGDPLQRSRFNTPEEKEAFIAADIEARRERRAAQREEREYEREVERQRRRVLAQRSTAPSPDAVALVEALDRLPEADRANLASAFVTALLGRSADLIPNLDPEHDLGAETAAHHRHRHEGASS